MAEDAETKYSEGSTQKVRTPPYIAFKTFQTLLTELKTNGLPPQIDRSVLTRFAGGLQGQIMLALRSLGLVDAQNRPTSELEKLVEASGTETFKAEMKNIIRDTYPYVFKLDLMSATPTMFADAFKDATDAKEDVLRKCRTFFLHAAKEVEIPIGPRIAQARTPRSPRTTPRKPKSKKINGTEYDPPAPPAPKETTPAMMDSLLKKFPDFDPSWSDDLKAKWFAGFDLFMKGIKDNGSS